MLPTSAPRPRAIGRSRPRLRRHDARLRGVQGRPMTSASAEIERRHGADVRHRRRSSIASATRSTSKARRRRADAEGSAGRSSAAPTIARGQAPRAQGGLRAPMCARAKPRPAGDSKHKALSVGSDPTAAIWCRTRPRPTIGRAAQGHLADPRHRRRPAGLRRRSTRSRSRSPAPATGWVGETAARPQTDDADARRAVSSRRWSSTPCRRRPRRCSTTRAVNIDMDRRGSADRLRRAGRRRLRQRRRHQQAARASSPTPRSPMRAGAGAISASSRRASPARSRRPTRPTS